MEKVLELLWKFLMSEAGATAVLSLIGLIIAKVLKTNFVKQHEMGRCVLALEAGVREVYETFVKSLKEAAADGKLTDSEKLEARDKAYQCAKQILETEGIDLAKYYGPRLAKAIIERLVNKSKTLGKIAKGILPVNAGE